MIISQSFKVIMAIVFYTSVEKSDANVMPLYESCFFSIKFCALLACVLKYQDDTYPKAYIYISTFSHSSGYFAGPFNIQTQLSRIIFLSFHFLVFSSLSYLELLRLIL